MNTTCLYQLPAQSSCQMMSYVLRTAVGRLIVMDGGCRADADALLAELKGAVPSAQRVGVMRRYEGGARIVLH